MIQVLDRRPILGRFIAFILFPLVLLGSGMVYSYRQSLPQNDQAVRLDEHSSGIELHRDDKGFVDIQGKSLESAFAGLGYAHAEDRLWQMELLRRKAAGKMAEVFGTSSLAADKFARTVDFYGHAAKDLESLSAQAVRVLSAYAEGVNRFLAENHRLPLEFSALGVAPQPWRPVDSLAVLKLHAFSQTEGFSNDLYRLMLSRLIGSAQMREAFKRIEDVPPATGGFSGTATGLAQLAQIEQQFLVADNSSSGSAWAVAPEFTKDAAALLATDLYHKAQMPAVYYVATLTMSGKTLSGVTLAGVPAILFGHNDAIAWGGSTYKADTQDVYIERLSMAEVDKVQYLQGFYPLTINEQHIAVKAPFPSMLRAPLPPYSWRGRESANGPLVSDALDGFGFPFSLKWTGFESKDSSFDALLGIALADNWETFKAAATQLVVPTINYVYADRRGNIGRLAAGAVPTKDGHFGSYPLPGWLSQYRWQGQTPAQSVSYNPKTGWLATADEPDSGALQQDAQPQYRFDRIAALLEQKTADGKLTLADMRALQLDLYDPFAARMTPLLLTLNPTGERQREALNYLSDWDNQSRGQSVAMTIFQAWTQAMVDRLVSVKAKARRMKPQDSKALSAWLKRNPAELLLHLFDSSGSDMCPAHDCRALSLAALDTALSQLTLAMGSDMSDWQWQRSHYIDYRHSVFADVNVLNRLFDRRIQTGGSAYSLSPGTAERAGDGGYAQDKVSALSAVIELSPTIKGQYSPATGQSGNLFSRFYDNAMENHHLPAHRY